MYQEFFHFKQEPFSIAPDPRFLFMSRQHKEALAHLLYGIQSSGAFMVLSGEVGSGKTTVCRCFLNQVPDELDIAFILNPKLNANELLASICDELGIAYPENSGTKVLVDGLNRFLLANHAKGRNTLVIIEEAQNLSEDVLEQLRLLTNLETDEKKLLQIILLAQPEFLDILKQDNMKQLAQRITARFHLSPLNESECEHYIQHRLNVAGSHYDPFPRAIKKQIFRYSQGVPRLINLLADRCLLGAYANNKQHVDKGILKQAMSELNDISPKQNRIKHFRTVLAITVITLLISTTVILFLSTEPWTPDTDKKSSLTEPFRLELGNKLANDSEPALQGLNIRSSYASASEQLINLWGLSTDRGYFIQNNQDLCDFAQVYQLLCYTDKANLGLLLKLGRPVILKLTTDGENFNFAVLLGTSGNKLLLQLADGPRALSYQSLEKLWLGDFITLVRVPSAWRGQVLNTGDQSEFAFWLNQMLEQLDDQSSGQNSENPYTYTLEDMKIVKRLQNEAGIYADGKVGLQTIMYLNSLTQNKVPVLQGSFK